MAGSCRRLAHFRQRLLVSAASHSDLIQYPFLHEMREIRTDKVEQKLLQYNEATARIPILTSRHDVDANGLGVRWLCAIEHLVQTRNLFTAAAAFEAAHCDARAVAQ